MNETFYSSRGWDTKLEYKKRNSILNNIILKEREHAIYEELQRIKSELLLNLDDKLINYIDWAYYNNLKFNVGEIYNVLKFLKIVYLSIFGTTDGLEDFLSERKELLSSGVNCIRRRLAIFTHFGLLKEVFVENTKYITADFTLVTTKDIYRMFSLGVINDLEGFYESAKFLSSQELDRLRNAIEVSDDTLVSLVKEMQDSLIRIRKKSVFLHTMSKKK